MAFVNLSWSRRHILGRAILLMPLLLPLTVSAQSSEPPKTFAYVRAISASDIDAHGAFGSVIKKYDLAHRTVIELPDPVLRPEDPVGDARLWYRPDR
jgi:hypothetical protein